MKIGGRNAVFHLHTNSWDMKTLTRRRIKKQNKLQINSAKFTLAFAEGIQRRGEGTDRRNAHSTHAEPDRRHNAEQEQATESQQSSNKSQHDKEANVSKTIHK